MVENEGSRETGRQMIAMKNATETPESRLRRSPAQLQTNARQAVAITQEIAEIVGESAAGGLSGTPVYRIVERKPSIMSSDGIVQVIAVVDVEFERNEVPKVCDARMLTSELDFEVQQQLGDGVGLAIAMGVSRIVPAARRGEHRAGITIPVSSQGASSASPSSRASASARARATTCTTR